ncbi:MAG: hypothetical protein GON13_00715 [Nanoarchaeota archaeon]|nr:hypothetical protein [Nanoarchaeota archaeon]
MKGIFHVHTKHSYDGVMNVSEIVQTFPEMDFIIITEHSETLNSNKYDILVKECKKENKKIIPGIEFNTDEGYHISGIFIKNYFKQTSAEQTIKKIKEQGGISILAHPAKYKEINFEKIKEVDFVEIWNRVYDGKYVLNPKNIELMKKLNAKPIVAIDFHKKNHKIDLYILTEKNIKKSLKTGKYQLFKGNKKINNELNLFLKLKRLSYEITKKKLLKFTKKI